MGYLVEPTPEIALSTICSAIWSCRHSYLLGPLLVQICSNPGRMPRGGMNLSSLFCLEPFLEPLRNSSEGKDLEMLPMVQMANDVLLCAGPNA